MLRCDPDSFLNGVPSIEVAKKLAERGVFLSHGDFYAMTVIERLGQAPHGLVRAGCACYTTSEEVDRLLTGVRGLSHAPISRGLGRPLLPCHAGLSRRSFSEDGGRLRRRPYDRNRQR